jgi:hypothetical protein
LSSFIAAQTLTRRRWRDPGVRKTPIALIIGAMNSRLLRTGPVLALTAAVAAPACAHAAGTYEEGKLAYKISGSYVAKGTANLSCTEDLPGGAFRDVDLAYPVTEKVTFKSTTGVVGYQGLVGKSVFFNRIRKYPKITIRVSRTGRPPGRCPKVPSDCGTKKVKGAVLGDFEGPFIPGRRMDLHVDFLTSRKGSHIGDPYKDCPVGEESAGWFADAVGPPVGSDYDFQAKALRYPKVKAFYSRKRRTLSGSSKSRNSKLKMKMTLKRTITKRQPNRAG